MHIAAVRLLLPFNSTFRFFGLRLLVITLLEPHLQIECLQLLCLILFCASLFPLAAGLDLFLFLFLLPPGLLVLVVHVVPQVADVSVLFFLFVFG